MRSSSAALALALFACSGRPLDSASDTATTSAASSTTATSSTGAPVTTTGPTTSTTSTTGLDSTSPASDLPPPPTPPLQGFGSDPVAPAGTALTGTSALGPFTGDRAWFGAALYNFEPRRPTLLVLSPEADPAVEFEQQDGSSGPILSVYEVDTAFELGMWLGTSENLGSVYAGGMTDVVAVTITITELAGNWDVADPLDPPRLVGSFAGEISGDFDAVYCDELDTVTIVE
jgi:hypothetical protein